MEQNSFIDVLFNDINSFRANPSSVNKRFENVKLTMSRFKGNDLLVKEIDQYIRILNSSKGVPPLKFDRKLSEVAEHQLESYESGEAFSWTADQADLEKRAHGLVEGFKKIYQIADQGTEDPTYVINRLIFNKLDKEKRNRKLLLDEDLKYVGIAQKIVNKQKTLVIIFADQSKEKLKIRKDVGDIEELRQAFELFDIHNMGRIDPRETVAAMRSLGWETRNPSVFQIMQELDTPENMRTLVSFEKFVHHIVDNFENNYSDDGLRRIFMLFVDDFVQETVSLTHLKKICRELGDETRAEEVRALMEKCGHSGTELTFDEFYFYMTTIYIKQNPISSQVNQSDMDELSQENKAVAA